MKRLISVAMLFVFACSIFSMVTANEHQAEFREGGDLMSPKQGLVFREGGDMMIQTQDLAFSEGGDLMSQQIPSA